MSNSSNGHKLVLFDIDGTLVSAGAVARDSILAALEAAYPLEGGRPSPGPLPL